MRDIHVIDFVSFSTPHFRKNAQSTEQRASRLCVATRLLATLRGLGQHIAKTLGKTCFAYGNKVFPFALAESGKWNQNRGRYWGLGIFVLGNDNSAEGALRRPFLNVTPAGWTGGHRVASESRKRAKARPIVGGSQADVRGWGRKQSYSSQWRLGGFSNRMTKGAMTSITKKHQRTGAARIRPTTVSH